MQPKHVSVHPKQILQASSCEAMNPYRVCAPADVSGRCLIAGLLFSLCQSVPAVHPGHVKTSCLSPFLLNLRPLLPILVIHRLSVDTGLPKAAHDRVR